MIPIYARRRIPGHYCFANGKVMGATSCAQTFNRKTRSIVGTNIKAAKLFYVFGKTVVVGDEIAVVGNHEAVSSMDSI
jgi:hypothetical protein